LPPLKKIEKITDFFNNRQTKIERNIIKGGFDFTGSKLIQIQSQRLANLPKQLRGFDNGISVNRKFDYSVIKAIMHKD